MTGDALYCWQTEVEGGWSQIGTLVPALGKELTLTFRDRDTAEQVRELAYAHGKALGQPVRLAVFTRETVLEESVHG